SAAGGAGHLALARCGGAAGGAAAASGGHQRVAALVWRQPASAEHLPEHDGYRGRDDWRRVLFLRECQTQVPRPSPGDAVRGRHTGPHVSAGDALQSRLGAGDTRP
nr:hypothetical protein [Tanacetum cinerariifolium]